MLERDGGDRPPGLQARDQVLGVLGNNGTAGGTGHVIEYAGSTIRGLSMEGRMTVCNMTVEAGARAGLVAPDETTLAHVKGRPSPPKRAQWGEALAHLPAPPPDAPAPFAQKD